MRFAVLIALLAMLCAPLHAREAAPVAADEAAERRLTAIAEELRCLVCQNESLAGSRADLAVDLRRQIREQIQAGRSDREILDYMVERYGDFVRYRPPLKSTTVLLWFGPFLLLAAGTLVLAVYLVRQRRREAEPPLSGEDQARVARMLGEDAAHDASADPLSAPRPPPPR